MKKIFLPIALVCLIVISIICIVYYQNYYQNVGQYWPKTVLFKPAGFVMLDSAVAEHGDLVRYEFYVDEDLFNEMVETARTLRSVATLPDGFIALDEAIAASGGLLDASFWKGRVSIYLPQLDYAPSHSTIYQTFKDNEQFIVKYAGDCYVNEEKWSEIREIAAIAYEQSQPV